MTVGRADVPDDVSGARPRGGPVLVQVAQPGR